MTTTGALRALKDVPRLAAALSGRIVVLEAVLLALCDRLSDRRRSAASQSGRVSPSDAMIQVLFLSWEPGSVGSTLFVLAVGVSQRSLSRWSYGILGRKVDYLTFGPEPVACRYLKCSSSVRRRRSGLSRDALRARIAPLLEIGAT